MVIRTPLIAVLMLAAAPAFAQAPQAPRNAPQLHVQAQAGDLWCRFDNLDHGSMMICNAYTYEQCMASRSPGNTGCFVNPRYDQRYRR
jgi:hypothetical protein